MGKVLAIAWHSMLGALRLRTVAGTVVFLIIVIAGLPGILEGDGTPEGQVKILLGYTLACTGFLLSISTLAASCSSIAPDIESRRIHMVMTKPVAAWQLWTGRWMGITLLQGVLLIAASSCILLMTLREASAPGLAPEVRQRLHQHLLVSMEPIEARQADLDARIRRNLDAAFDEVPEIRYAEARQWKTSLGATLEQHLFTVTAGSNRTWKFTLPADRPAIPEPPQFKFLFRTSEPGVFPIAGRWTFHTPSGEVVHVEEGNWLSGKHHFLHLPAPIAGLDEMLATFDNRPSEKRLSVVFSGHDGLHLLLHRGGFIGNFIRAVLCTFAQLAFLAALGVTLSALFSTPVAGFAAVAVFVVLQMTGYIGEMAESDIIVEKHTHSAEEAEPTALDRAYGHFFRALDAMVTPLRRNDIIEPLTTGVWIRGSTVTRSFLSRLLVAGGLLAVAGTAVLRKRELGLPT